jgi:hypothetical protein
MTDSAVTQLINKMKDDFNNFVGIFQTYDRDSFLKVEDILYHDAISGKNDSSLEDRGQALVFAAFVFRALRFMGEEYNQTHDFAGQEFSQALNDSNIKNNTLLNLRFNQQLKEIDNNRAEYLTTHAEFFYENFKDREVLIKYTNYAGVTEMRNIIPDCVKFMRSKWHDNGQLTWILIALDCEKMEGREFRLLDIEGQI